MYTNTYVYTSFRNDMAKLYWRIKKDGKWTWLSAQPWNTMVMFSFGTEPVEFKDFIVYTPTGEGDFFACEEE